MLVHSKLRSWLTILGIFIGITAVVAIVSIGQGLQASVSSQISGLGQDLITISAGSSRAVGGGFGGGERAGGVANALSDREISALKLVSGIKSISGTISGRATMRYQNQNASASITGLDAGVMKDFVTASLESGRFLQSGDVRVAVIGYGVAHSMFSSQLSAGSLISIGDKPFRVVGILASASGFGGGDNGIYVSTSDARSILNNSLSLDANQYSSIMIKVNDVNQITSVNADVEQALINSRHVTASKEDFSISTAQALQQRFSSVTSSISIFLAILAGVSLLVGGIGVANTMFTSVLEKTKDIGIMKAIGAKNSDIMLIFLLNSGMLGLVGGILGVVGGAAAGLALPLFGISIGIGGRGGLQTLVSPGLLIFAIVFSVGIGMVSGAYPAYRASKLKPVDALRYE